MPIRSIQNDPAGWAVLLGTLVAYGALCALMRVRKSTPPLSGQFFLIFATWGALLFVLVATALKTWSDAVTLAGMYLLLAAPFVLLMVAAQLRRLCGISPFHKAAFYAAVTYPALWLPIVAVYFVLA